MCGWLVGCVVGWLFGWFFVWLVVPALFLDCLRLEYGTDRLYENGSNKIKFYVV